MIPWDAAPDAYVVRRAARAVAEIVGRYQARGLTGPDLHDKLERHARLLQSMEPRVAAGLRVVARRHVPLRRAA